MSDVAAIPTLYRGVQYRSRLEARWAALLDVAGVFFDYEPDVGTRAYIPDFLVHLGDARVIFEGKPIADTRDFLAPQAKVQRSGWRGPVAIVGGSLEIGPDGFPDLVARACLDCRPIGTQWFPLHRASWPPTWGACPFPTPGDLMLAWKQAGNATQWRPPESEPEPKP